MYFVMSHFSSDLLSISCWNVHGLSHNFILGSKLMNDEFLHHINNCDLIVWSETWRPDEFDIPGYKFFISPSIKHIGKKNDRSSGGIALGFKNSLMQGIKLISTHKNFIWMKLDKTFLKRTRIFTFVVCTSPHGNPHISIKTR